MPASGGRKWNNCTAKRRVGRIPACCAAVILAALLTGGCSEPPKEKFLGVTQIGDKVTDSELERFLQVVEQLPDGKLPELPAFFGPAPDWSPSRTLPIHDLVKEEQLGLDARWETEELAKHLEPNRRLRRALRHAEMNLGEFCNLVKALGAALCRNGLRPEQDLESILEQSKIPLEKLQKDDRTFSEIPREEMYTVLRQAIWVTRQSRAKLLSQVPPENLALVRKHADALTKAFPHELAANPFDPLIDLLDARGMPFEELTETGSDADVEWSNGGANRGIDKPDSEYQLPGAVGHATPAAPEATH